MSFDVIAPHYRWLEFVLAGEKLQRCRTSFLHGLAAPDRVLIVGEGNGRFLAECRRAFPAAAVTCVDACAGMLSRADRRLHRLGLNRDGIEWVHADALAWWPPPAGYDLLVTHFFLDCFPPDQLRRVITSLARAAAPSATWLLADFCVPAAGFARRRAQSIVWMMYAFFRLVTRLPARRLTVPDPFLGENGFELRGRRLSEWGLLHSDRWERPWPRQPPGAN